MQPFYLQNSNYSTPFSQINTCIEEDEVGEGRGFTPKHSLFARVDASSNVACYRHNKAR